MRDVELHLCKRFEWERIIRRARLGHDDIKHLLDDPNSRRATGTVVKGVALVLATFASSDGTRARPGERRLAHSLESSELSVRTACNVLEQVGLIEYVSGGRGGNRQATEWRLVRPDDLADVVTMSDPTEQPNRTTRSDRNRTTRSVDADESEPTNRTTRHSQPNDSSAQPNDSYPPTERLVRTQEQDQPETRTQTAPDQEPDSRPARARAREAARSARR